MRRLSRPSLPLASRKELARRRKTLLASGDDARGLWNNYRRSKAATIPLEHLRAMTGRRARCVYCADSMGADVDHYYPIARNRELTFAWHNWLWICPTCNRYKSNRFPVSENGYPLLIDPSKRDPWDHLILDTSTGMLAPRFRLDGDFDAAGEATLDILTSLNNEAVVEGRARTIRRIRHAISEILKSDGSPDSMRWLAVEIAEDDYGVSVWFFAREGRNEEEFEEFSRRLPALWRRALKRCARI
jgi:5-methylcytosine-specific restriction endonuclease McrA